MMVSGDGTLSDLARSTVHSVGGDEDRPKSREGGAASREHGMTDGSLVAVNPSIKCAVARLKLAP
jgi:hypothetical protein